MLLRLFFLNSESPEARRGERVQEDGTHASPAHDSIYCEIPTKESHMADNGIHEIPTKDTEGNNILSGAGEICV